MSPHFRFAWSILLIASLSLLAVPGAFGQSDKAHIDYRQKVMKSIGANIGAIGDILKNKLPLGGNIAGHAENIGRNAEMIASAFEKRITAGPTDSKPAIWENSSKFQGAADDLVTAAKGVAKAAGMSDAGAIGAAMKKLGESCKACHKDFRKPKEESFKKK